LQGRLSIERDVQSTLFLQGDGLCDKRIVTIAFSVCRFA
jgi:hypothetical protein